ncbi:MFS transporter [Streptomyces alboflavus]|uniref:MFS transporter n=1 Tax=Streptomyces alboflavus TaxID=67267 RepID=A0A1Z1WCQ2_9ACTN|nr:MFS transporter [Streptomyces alboflavus]ARX84214.1 MFS transporter [Streptomyces alboflavus]
MAPTTKIRPHTLVRASGGPRYATALAVDSLGTGLLRPFLLLYGVTVLDLSAPATGIAMTAGIVVGLGCMPAVGRWLDRGARSAVVAASMLVRAAGVVLLLSTPTGHVWLFGAAALVLGVGNQAWPPAHAALVATVAHGRERDAALAAGRALRNAGMGLGALVATACLAGGAGALQVLAGLTGAAYLCAAGLAWSVRVDARASTGNTGGEADAWRGGRSHGSASGEANAPAPRLRKLLTANVIYVFCLNVPEIALPLVLVTQLNASPAWSALVFVANTALVVTLQVPVTVLMSRRFNRRTVLALAGVVLTVSYAGFLAATSLGGGWGAPAVAAVSVVCTLGEIVYAGSATALVTALAPPHALGRTLARFELSTGFGLAVSPAAITALAPHGPTALWGSLAVATLMSASAVATDRELTHDSAVQVTSLKGHSGA